MVVIVGVELDEEVVAAGGEVALYDFGDLLEAVDYLIELGGVLEEESDIGAGVKSDRGGIDVELRALDDAYRLESGDALMDSGAGYFAFTCYLQEGSSGVVEQEVKDFDV